MIFCHEKPLKPNSKALGGGDDRDSRELRAAALAAVGVPSCWKRQKHSKKM